MRILFVPLALVLAGCAETAAEAPTPCCAAYRPQPPSPPPPPPQPVASSPSYVSSLPASRVLVLQSTHTEGLTEVVGVVDVHAEMGGQEAALEALKRKAEQMGADAVVGVEFHHGHGEEEPTHLSGLAVRFLERRP